MPTPKECGCKRCFFSPALEQLVFKVPSNHNCLQTMPFLWSCLYCSRAVSSKSSQYNTANELQQLPPFQTLKLSIPSKGQHCLDGFAIAYRRKLACQSLLSWTQHEHEPQEFNFAQDMQDMGVPGWHRGNCTHPPPQKLGFSLQCAAPDLAGCPIDSVYRRGKHIIIVTAVTTPIRTVMHGEMTRKKNLNNMQEKKCLIKRYCLTLSLKHLSISQKIPTQDVSQSHSTYCSQVCSIICRSS